MSACVRDLEQSGQLIRIKKEVDPNLDKKRGRPQPRDRRNSSSNL